jgi:glycine/D-amino acid oxidase-like deaminating enzyme
VPKIPRSRGVSYWLREALEADPGEPCPPLKGEATADVVILGGGYTGLWAAWFLTERAPGIDVVVLEASVCGSGASGRNGGFVGPWWDSADELAARYGDSAVVNACRASDESVRAIGEWCATNEVDAWYRPAPYLEVASSPAQEGAWSDAVAACRRLGAPDGFRELIPEQVQAVCRSPAFGGGAAMVGATLQPARLARGLRRVLLGRGVRIHEHSPAVGVGRGIRVTTPEGAVRAQRAVLGMNAWARRWLALRRVIVVRGSYILLTAPAPDRLADLGWTGGEPICDLRTALHYFRTTPDGRIAFGGVGRARGIRVSAEYDHDGVSLDWIREAFHRIFPSFRDVPIEEGWGGPVDVSATRHPWFGTLPGGRVHYGVGYSGHGVAQAHLGGRVLSALALDAEDEVTRLPMVDREPKRFPPALLTAVGTRLVQEAVLRKDRLEDVGRRPGPVTRLLASMPRRLGYALGASPLPGGSGNPAMRWQPSIPPRRGSG